MSTTSRQNWLDMVKEICTNHVQIHQQTDITALNNKRREEETEHGCQSCTLCKNHNKLKQNKQNLIKVQTQASTEVLETSTI